MIKITPAILELMERYRKDGEVEFKTKSEQNIGLVLYNILAQFAEKYREGGDGQFSGGFYQEHFTFGNSEISVGIQNGIIFDMSFKVVK